MVDWTESDTRSGYDIPLLAAVSIPIAVAPFSYLLGSLYIVHLVPTAVRAVWLSTVALTSIAIAVYAVISGSET